MRTYLKTLEGTYSVSTVQISKAPLPSFVQAMTMLGDEMMGNEEGAGKDFETMLFFNGRPAEYPFGDLPGNKVQGVYQRYATKEEANKGHDGFVARVRAVLAEKERV